MIMGWLMLAVYLVGVPIAARVLYVRFDEKDPQERYGDNGLAATVFGTFWPVVILGTIGQGLYSALTRTWRLTVMRETPRQRRVRLAKVDEANQRAAVLYGLPWPGDIRTSEQITNDLFAELRNGRA